MRYLPHILTRKQYVLAVTALPSGLRNKNIRIPVVREMFPGFKKNSFQRLSKYIKGRILQDITYVSFLPSCYT